MSGWHLNIVYLHGPSVAGVEMYVDPSVLAGISSAVFGAIRLGSCRMS